MKIKEELRKPIIFIGTGRSGTTIFSEIVMRHPDLAYISNYQVKFKRFPQVNFLRIIFQNNLWNFHGQKPQLNRVDFFNKFKFNPVEGFNVWNYLVRDDVNFSRDFLLNQTPSSEEIFRIRNYFQNVVKFQGKNRLALKLTGPSRIGYLLSIFPDATFINLTRREIPVIKSFLKVPFWKKRGYKDLWWNGAYSSQELELANKIKHCPILLTAFQLKKIKMVTYDEIQKFKPNILEVSYEDFVLNPKEVLERTLNFLELEDRSDACFSYLEKNTIIDRNNHDTDYFSQKKLVEINDLDKILTK